MCDPEEQISFLWTSGYAGTILGINETYLTHNKGRSM